jgi:hypothetical protein
MDAWIKFIINNLNQINDEYGWEWAESLLGTISEYQEKFNSGKFRGAIFNLNFISAERKATQRLETGYSDK